MLVWLKSHYMQVATLALACAVGVALHLGKLSPDQATEIGALLALVGIHLPPITYKFKPPPAALLAFGLLLAVACVPANYAKDLDKCAFDNVGNKPAIHECQCQVSQQYGRSCDWLKADGVDAGAPISEGGAQ